MTSCPGHGTDAVAAAVRGIHPRVVSGYLMDAIVGGSHIQWCYSDREHDSGFDRWFSMLNGHGIGAGTLRRLLRPEVFGDSLDEILTRVRRRFMENGDSHLERSWRFDLEHRQRFHIGEVLVRQMKAAWPVAPHIDREVLATAGGIPLGALAARVVEREMVMRFHPDLARLPLDRGGDNDTSPLDPDVRAILRSLPGRAIRRASSILGLPRRERRSWVRTTALDGSSWREVRRDWEATRSAAYDLFVPEVLDAFLARPGEPWPPGFSLVETSGRKLLMGAAVWYQGDR